MADVWLVLQIIIRGFMALNAAEEERRIEESTPVLGPTPSVPSARANAAELPLAIAGSDSGHARALPHA